MMKSLIVVFALLGVSSQAVPNSCMKGTAPNGLTEEASCNYQECQSPKFTPYTGYADAIVEGVQWICGDCSASPASTSNCDTCNDGDNCNAVVETTEFLCLGWSYDTTASKWEQSGSATCSVKQSDGEPLICNAPNRNTADTADKYTLTLNGCGPCDADEKTAGNCLEIPVQCTSDGCSASATDGCSANGSAALSVSAILAVISFLYMM